MSLRRKKENLGAEKIRGCEIWVNGWVVFKDRRRQGWGRRDPCLVCHQLYPQEGKGTGSRTPIINFFFFVFSSQHDVALTSPPTLAYYALTPKKINR